MNLGTGRTIQITLDGRGTVTLRPVNHVATGGEGVIYKISDMVVKIYLDPMKMKQEKLPEKIRKLTALKHPYVIAPSGLAFASGEPVGYYMPYVEDPPVAYPLSRMFTNEFYRQEGFDMRLASILVGRMRDTVLFAHANGALLVDPNELNWFAMKVRKDPEPRIVDVDSWALDSWPATVIMPSVRDWHAKQFNIKTDWFAWGIVTFQVYTGIHPYKGTLDGYGRADLEKRMKDNASVFTQGVRLNRAVRDFSCIPGALLDWYEAVFQKGERTEPPTPFATGMRTPRAVQVLRIVTTGRTGMLEFEKLLGFAGDPVTRIFFCGTAITKSSKLFDISTKRHITELTNPHSEVIKVANGWLVGMCEGQETKFMHVHEGTHKTEILRFTCRAYRILTYENRMFVVTDDGLMEIKSTVLGDKLFASAGQTWGVIVNSTKWLTNMGIFGTMGAKFIIVPFGENAVAQVRVREIDDLSQIVAAKAGHRFVSLVGLEKSGHYRKVELTFDHDYHTYGAKTTIVDGPELNIAILPKGVCATIVKDGELIIFVPVNGKTLAIEDGEIASDFLLANYGDRVLYIKDGEIWTVRVK